MNGPNCILFYVRETHRQTGDGQLLKLRPKAKANKFNMDKEQAPQGVLLREALVPTLGRDFANLLPLCHSFTLTTLLTRVVVRNRLHQLPLYLAQLYLTRDLPQTRLLQIKIIVTIMNGMRIVDFSQSRKVIVEALPNYLDEDDRNFIHNLPLQELPSRKRENRVARSVVNAHQSESDEVLPPVIDNHKGWTGELSPNDNIRCVVSSKHGILRNVQVSKHNGKHVRHIYSSLCTGEVDVCVLQEGFVNVLNLLYTLKWFRCKGSIEDEFAFRRLDMFFKKIIALPRYGEELQFKCRVRKTNAILYWVREYKFCLKLFTDRQEDPFSRQLQCYEKMITPMRYLPVRAVLEAQGGAVSSVQSSFVDKGVEAISQPGVLWTLLKQAMIDAFSEIPSMISSAITALLGGIKEAVITFYALIKEKITHFIEMIRETVDSLFESKINFQFFKDLACTMFVSFCKVLVGAYESISMIIQTMCVLVCRHFGYAIDASSSHYNRLFGKVETVIKTPYVRVSSSSSSVSLDSWEEQVPVVDDSDVFIERLIARESGLCESCLLSPCGCFVREVDTPLCAYCMEKIYECTCQESTTEDDSWEMQTTTETIDQNYLVTDLDEVFNRAAQFFRGKPDSMIKLDRALAEKLQQEEKNFQEKNDVNSFLVQRGLTSDEILCEAQGFQEIFSSAFLFVMSGISLSTVNQAVNVLSRGPALIENGVEMIKKIIDFFYFRAYEEHCFTPIQEINDLEEWLGKVKSLHENPNIDDEIIFSMVTSSQVSNLAQEVSRFRSLVQSYPANMPRKVYMLQLIDWVAKKAAIVRSESVLYNSRIETIMLYLHGEPGVGKTTATYHIIAGVYKLMHTLMPGLYPEQFSSAQIFSKPKNQDYWDGYRGQFCVYDPEILEQSLSTERAKKISEIMSMCDTGIMPLNYAHVDQKGSRCFSSPLYCCSTNIRDEAFGECGMTDPSAFFRRRTFKLEVLKRKQLKKDLSNVHKAWTFRMHIPNKTQNKKMWDAFVLAIPERLRKFLTENIPPPYLDLSFSEIIVLMAQEIFLRHEKQQATASALRTLDYSAMADEICQKSFLLRHSRGDCPEDVASAQGREWETKLNFDDEGVDNRMSILQYWQDHSDVSRCASDKHTPFARLRSWFNTLWFDQYDERTTEAILYLNRNARGKAYVDTLPYMRDYFRCFAKKLKIDTMVMRLISDLFDDDRDAKKFLISYIILRRVPRIEGDGVYELIHKYLSTLNWTEDGELKFRFDGHFQVLGSSMHGDYGPLANVVLASFGLNNIQEAGYHDHIATSAVFCENLFPTNFTEGISMIEEVLEKFSPVGSMDVEAFGKDVRSFMNNSSVSFLFWSTTGLLISSALAFATYKGLEWLVSPSAVSALKPGIPVPEEDFDKRVEEVVQKVVSNGQSLPKYAPTMKPRSFAQTDIATEVKIQDTFDAVPVVEDSEANSLPKYMPTMKPRSVAQSEAEAQGTIMENIAVLRNSVFQHLRIVSFQYPDGSVINCRASLYGSRVLVFRHSLEAYGPNFDCMWLKNGEFVQQCFKRSELRICMETTRDRAIIDLPRYFQPITIPKGRLLSREAHARFCANKNHKFERMIKMTVNGVPQMQLVQANYFQKGEKPTASRFGDTFNHYTRFSDYYMAIGGLGESGDCGALYIGTDTTTGQVYILGDHVARSGYDSYLCPIFDEDMAKEVAYITAQGETIYRQGMYTPDCVANLQFDGKSDCDSRLFQMGKAKKVKIIPRKTCFRPSVFQGTEESDSIFPITMAPALLTKTQVEVEGKISIVTPLSNALVKVVSPPVRMIPNYYNMLATDEDVFWKLCDGFYPDTTMDFNPLEIEDVVFGCEEYEGLDQTTAVGYDMEILGFTSRKLLWDVKNRWIHPKLREMVGKIILALKLGFSVRNVVAACLKDELRDLERVCLGKTRLFCVGGLAHLIVTIMFLGPIVSFLKKHRMRTDVAIGTNPHGIDWSLIYRKLQSQEGFYGGGDFSNYDTSVRSQVSYALGFTMCLWAGIDPLSYFGWCIIQLCHSATGAFMVIVNTVVLMDYMNSSGNWLTGVLNSFCNCTLFNAFWYEIQQKNPELQGQKLNQYVSKEFYGDDNLFKVSPKIAHLFNMRTLGEYVFANFGMTLTLPDKGGIEADFIERSQFTFLARDFVEDGSVILAPLDFDSITGMLLWIRDPKEHDGVLLTHSQQLSINTGVAAMECYHYGRERFEIVTQRIKQFCVKYGVTYLGKTYNYYRERHVCGMLSD